MSGEDEAGTHEGGRRPQKYGQRDESEEHEDHFQPLQDEGLSSLRPRSMSAPVLRAKPSRIEYFVAGLVSDVEEYMGRGGYNISPDDRDEDTDVGPIARRSSASAWLGDEADDSSMHLLHHNSDVVSNDTRWRWGRWGRRARWRTEHEEDSEGGLDAALLSDVPLRAPDGERLAAISAMPPQPPRDLILRRARSFTSSQYGGNSIIRTVITFLKGMLGSYVLYLPRMFAEGGMVFSIVVVTVLSVASTYNMLLLLRCRDYLARRGISACSFGEVGFAALGSVGWVGVDISLFLSQLGYCVVYLIFVAENLGPVLRRVFSHQPAWLLGTLALILAQACIQIPLSWVRRLKYLGAGMFVANACVFGGLLLILIEVLEMFRLSAQHLGGPRSTVMRKLVEDGAAGEHTGGRIALINPGDCLILLGAAVGCFEGIGLVLPIQDAMDLRVRDRLPAALCWSMAGITAFFIAFGAAGYLAYGRDVEHFITMDLPEKTLVGTLIRVAYSIGLILTSPLQLFPAVKVIERLVWPAPTDGVKKPMPDRRRKWLKNLLRAGLVAFTVFLALVAGDRFDSFVGIVGGVCAIPLALVYPPLFHLSLFGKQDTTAWAILHWFLLVMGVIAGVASTVVSVRAMF